jgi:hypothetical protein|tara:strand:- start:1183 stop:1368 length:186 start_codon:yes stop_codon:yes gene_type:complete
MRIDPTQKFITRTAIAKSLIEAGTPDLDMADIWYNWIIYGQRPTTETEADDKASDNEEVLA